MLSKKYTGDATTNAASQSIQQLRLTDHLNQATVTMRTQTDIVFS